MSILNEIEHLRKEAETQRAEADRLEALLAQYPDLRKHQDRGKKVYYCSAFVNTVCTDYLAKHTCGCCQDSPLDVWPYLETHLGRVYADPPYYQVGEREPFCGGDVPYKDWEEGLRKAGIPEPILTRVGHLFPEARKKAQELLDATYASPRNPNEDEPLI
jgi:hypothetical protein